MKRTSELIWEFAIAFIAFAGAFTLLKNFFPSIPAYVFGLFFLLAFIFIIVSFGYRFYENQHPVKIIVADMTINTCDEPKLDIKLGFSSHDKTNIDTFISIKFDSQLQEQLDRVATFYPYCRLKTADGKNIIPIDANGYVEISDSIPVKLNEGYTKDDLEAIAFYDKAELGWNIVGHKTSWVKMSCFYMPILPELAKCYPTMVKKRKHNKKYYQ